MILDCETLEKILAPRRLCERAEFGVRIATQCLYPSASPVFVHVGEWKDGFLITDAGGAADCAAQHGRDDHAISIGLNQASARYSLAVNDHTLTAFVPAKEWIPAAVMAVANGAAHAATVALERVIKTHEQSLKAKINEVLAKSVPDRLIARGFDYVGKSGKHWCVDYAIMIPQRTVLIKAVTPHHSSVAATYTTFGDIRSDENLRFAVFKRRLVDDDAALLRQVGDMVPLGALSDSASELVGVRFN